MWSEQAQQHLAQWGRTNQLSAVAARKLRAAKRYKIAAEMLGVGVPPRVVLEFMGYADNLNAGYQMIYRARRYMRQNATDASTKTVDLANATVEVAQDGVSEDE